MKTTKKTVGNITWIYFTIPSPTSPPILHSISNKIKTNDKLNHNMNILILVEKKYYTINLSRSSLNQDLQKKISTLTNLYNISSPQITLIQKINTQKWTN
nr:hypothetical protein [Acromitus sp. 1 MKL-2023]